MSSSNSLPGFSRASSNVLVSISPLTHGTTVPNAPDLIIINAWMGAALKHAAKYTAKYAELFPSSRIVLTTNNISDIMRHTESYLQEKLKPAVDVVRSTVESVAPRKPLILVHNFSNGGNQISVQMTTLYKKLYGEPLPATAIIIDSAPGRVSWSGSIAAFSASLPKNPILRLLGGLVTRFFVAALYVQGFVSRKPDLLEIIRKRLLDPTLFVKSAPRTYIYSKADQLVGWRDVEDHIEQSRKQAFTVFPVKFDNSRHVAHAITDGERYWSEVGRCWDRALKQVDRIEEIDRQAHHL